MSNDLLFEMPKASYSAVVLAIFKLYNWQPPDHNGPLTVSLEEQVTLARRVIAAVSEYLPAAERERMAPDRVAHLAERESAQNFRFSTDFVASTETVDGAPGCRVGVGRHVVNIRFPGKL